MGHSISATLLKGPFDEEKAKSFDLRVIRLEGEIMMFQLTASYCDHWSEKLGVSGFISRRPLLNAAVVHHMMNAIAVEPLFAVIETDYFGGRGSQSAAVYRGWKEIMTPRATRDDSGEYGPINDALRHLGVVTRGRRDKFDTLGLGQYRDFEDLFEDYWDET